MRCSRAMRMIRSDGGEDLELVGHPDVVAVGRHAVGDDAVAHLAFLKRLDHALLARHADDPVVGLQAHHAPPVERESGGDSGRTGLVRRPRFSLSMVTSSPSSSGPTPEGVPVRMRSPGTSVMTDEM